MWLVKFLRKYCNILRREGVTLQQLQSFISYVYFHVEFVNRKEFKKVKIFKIIIPTASLFNELKIARKFY